ncbi:hypothetical protein QUF72_22805 [Desulfobacterales bacterium HSG2]|nr:hypothetical protein [Desulfobacterales bacterium HSG2]
MFPGKSDRILTLSGIKADELAELLWIYTENHFECRWREIEKDCAALSCSGMNWLQIAEINIFVWSARDRIATEA